LTVIRSVRARACHQEDFYVPGADPSSMFAEAQKLAIETSNEAEFLEKLDKAEGRS
jgi:hypothetical protein